MSEQAGNRPADWRRRRSRSSGGSRRNPSGSPRGREADASGADSGTDSEGILQQAGAGSTGLSSGPGESEVVSRTLFSFLEPFLDAIGSFGAPMVIAGIFGVVSGVVVVAFINSMQTYGIINIGIGASLIGVVAVIYLSAVVAAFLGRTGRYGINSVIMIAAFTGIVVVINFVLFEKNSRIDVTATNQFSLHGSTKDLLKSLDEPVRATAFYLESAISDIDRTDRRNKVENTFQEFEAVRSSKFSYRFIDPTLKPDIVREYFGSTPTPFIDETVVVEGLDSKVQYIIQPTDSKYSTLEQGLYTSILVVSGIEQKTVYFLAGHGERNIQSASQGRTPDPTAYDAIRAGLERDNYDVRVLKWNLQQEAVAIPDGPGEGCVKEGDECLPGAALLVIAGPSEELPLAHAQALDLYLRGFKIGPDGNPTPRREGGRLIFLAEPNTPESFRGLLATWGALLHEGYILDEINSVESLPRTLQLQHFNPVDLPEEIARRLDQDKLRTLIGITAPRGQSLGVTRMPGAAPIQILNDPNRISLSAPLAITSEESYLIEDLERTKPIKGSGDDADPKSSYAAVVFLESVGPVGEPPRESQPELNELSSMVVFGDSDFLSNANYDVGSGADLFINSANYLMDDYSLVSIRPKASTVRELNLDRNELRFVRWSSILLIPGVLALMAGLVWWVRR